MFTKNLVNKLSGNVHCRPKTHQSIVLSNQHSRTKLYSLNQKIRSASDNHHHLSCLLFKRPVKHLQQAFNKRWRHCTIVITNIKYIKAAHNAIVMTNSNCDVYGKLENCFKMTCQVEQTDQITYRPLDHTLHPHKTYVRGF